MENKLIRKADNVICVSRSIQEWYEQKYDIVVEYIPNAPEKLTQTDSEVDLKELFNYDDKSIVGYIGAFAPSRGLDILIDIIRREDTDLLNKYNFVFVGYGMLAPVLRDLSEKYPMVCVVDPVAPTTLTSLCGQFDIGLAVFSPKDESYVRALPNKIFSYLHASLHVLVENHCIDMVDLFKSVGHTKYTKVHYSPDALLSALLATKTNGGDPDSSEYCDLFWENMEYKFLEMIR